MDKSKHDEGRHEECLLVAAGNGNLETLTRLLDEGVDIETHDFFRRTPLHIAAESGQAGCVRELLARGADVNSKDSTGTTPLLSAFEIIESQPSKDVVGALLAAGADTEARLGVDKHTALYLASKRGDTACVDLLLEHGANPHARDIDGFTPLHAAARSGAERTVAALVAHGADIGAQTKWGDTPLHSAAENNKPGCVAMLLDCGADIGATKIQYAC